MAVRDEDRILTVPNALSVGRLLCLPLFLWLLFGQERRFAAAALLGVLCATDCLDGYIARHFNQASDLGKALDPIADRVLLAVGGTAILIDGSVPLWLGLAALAREVMVGTAALVLALKKAARIEVQLLGKAGNFLLMTAFPFFLVANPDGGASWHEVARVVAWAAAVPGLVLSWYSAVRYVPLAKDALARGRVGSGHQGGTDSPSSDTPRASDTSKDSDTRKERTS